MSACRDACTTPHVTKVRRAPQRIRRQESRCVPREKAYSPRRPAPPGSKRDPGSSTGVRAPPGSKGDPGSDTGVRAPPGSKRDPGSDTRVRDAMGPEQPETQSAVGKDSVSSSCMRRYTSQGWHLRRYPSQGWHLRRYASEARFQLTRVCDSVPADAP